MPGEHEYPDALTDGQPRGRGAGLNPADRHQDLRLHVLGEHLDTLGETVDQSDAEPGDASGQVSTQVLPDKTRRIINRVQSPDIGFKWTVNPYRGCEHGCVYCYARPDHERLGYSCGLDFETRIMAKHEAPAMLRRELAQPRWTAEPIVFSGVTDCYQPIERRLRIMRGCVEVCAEAAQPISIVTKSRLVTRDIDLLGELAQQSAVRVAVSITTLETKLAAKLEPRAASPNDRLRTINDLSAAGIPVSVMAAPVIPAITDRELPAILEAASQAGASAAGYVLLRLPHQLKALFLDWLQRHYPDRAEHVESLIRQARGGDLYDATPVKRRRGEGAGAEQIRSVFQVFAKRHGLDHPVSPLNSADFHPPVTDGQATLF